MGKQFIHWIILGLSLWMVVVVFIPWRHLKRLLLPALLTGFLMTFFLNFIAIKLGIWHFESKALTVFETPVGLSVAWYAAILFYDYLVLIYGRYKFYLITFFVGLTGAVFSTAVMEGHILLEHWAVVEILFMAIFTHCFSIIVMRLFIKDNNNINPDERPLGFNKTGD